MAEITVTTVTIQMCFSTLRSVQMLVLSLMETGQRNTLSPLYCLQEEMTDKTQSNVVAHGTVSFAQLSALTTHSLEEGKGLDFFGGPPDTHKTLYVPSMQSQASCGITTSYAKFLQWLEICTLFLL